MVLRFFFWQVKFLFDGIKKKNILRRLKQREVLKVVTALGDFTGFAVVYDRRQLLTIRCMHVWGPRCYAFKQTSCVRDHDDYDVWSHEDFFFKVFFLILTISCCRYVIFSLPQRSRSASLPRVKWDGPNECTANMQGRGYRCAVFTSIRCEVSRENYDTA